MNVEKAIYGRLSGYAGLTALVSTRIYPLVLPENATMPAVVYTLVSVERPSCMGSDSGIASARVQVDCWGSTYATTKAAAEQVRAALQRFRGTVSSVTVQDCFLDGEQDLYEPETTQFRTTMDFMIHCQE